VNVVPVAYRCGVIRDPTLPTVVTAGLGTSELPVRWNVPPDLWVVTLGPAAR
jgi:predicted MPP superfamily phosphohydrolase